MSDDAAWAQVFVRGGHPGGSASSYRILRRFRREFRPCDLLLSSKGHDAAAFLIDAIDRGHLAGDWLDRYRRVNGYPGHPERGVTPGALVSTGSLGMGLSKAVGLALADRSRRVICLVGDGELQEGQVWEACQQASRFNLDNLVVLLDHNGKQSDNRPLPQPNVLWPEGVFKAAGWGVYPLPPEGDSWPFMPGLPLCVLVHGDKSQPHALSTPSALVLAYGKALRSAMEADDRLVVLEADLAADHGLDGLEGQFPGRVLACGISEQGMVGTAVGLAAGGWHPVCHTFARFYLRAAEQVYDALREPGLAIRFVGGLAGMLPIGPGPSHHLDRQTERWLWAGVIEYTAFTAEEVAKHVASMVRQPRSTYLRLPAQPELGGG